MRLHFNSTSARTRVFTSMLAVFLLGAALSGAAQNRAFIQQNSDQGRPSVANMGYRSINGNLRCGVQGSSTGTPCFANETNFATLFDAAQRESEQSATYRDLVERQRIRAAQEAAVRERTDGIAWYSSQPYEEVAVQSHANPEAADQSELLKNSKDRDFILRNFRTMYVDAHNAKYFGSDQMKAALGKNKDFWKLNIRIVDDRHVADVVLKVGYTFAWDFPFELTHQNTTIVLVSGKGEGPFSGPLGAADVARQFVNMAKPWREEKKKSDH